MRLRAQFRTFDDSQGVSIAIGPYTFRPSAKLLHDVANNRRVRLTSKEVAILKLLYRSGVYPADVIVQHQATCVPFNPSTACKPPERGQWTPRYDQSLGGRPRGPPPDVLLPRGWSGRMHGPLAGRYPHATTSIRLLPHCWQRHRSCTNGTTPRPLSTSACRSASRDRRPCLSPKPIRQNLLLPLSLRGDEARHASDPACYGLRPQRPC